MIRELQFGDLSKLTGFCPDDFPFPNLGSGLYCSQKALIDRGNLAGAALLKITSEAVLILDNKINEMHRAALIAEAFKEVPKEMKKFGLDQVHVFVLPEKDEQYAAFLMRHFGFERATGIPLVWTRK